MNKPRILFVTPLPPPVHGSAMMSQYIMDSKLLREEFDCDFVNLSTSRRMDEIGKGGGKKLLRFIGSFFIVFFKLLIRRYDLCYLAITCHGTGFLKDAPFVLLCKLFGRKVIIHQHNKGMSTCVDKQPYKWFLPLVYKNTKVILLSWFLYPDIEKVVKKEQVFVCPNGIPKFLEEVPCLERKNVIPHLLFLSNLIPSKGVYVLLDACKILKENGYKFICNFVGGESKEITKDTFAKAVDDRGLNDVINYKGAQYGEDKAKAFLNTNIFIFPTFYYNECFPLVLLEAMQWSLPIVSTEEGGIPDIVRDGESGFVCMRKDANSVAEAIGRLIDNPQLRLNMGEQGLQLYNRYFTLERFEENFVGILKLCLDRVV